MGGVVGVVVGVVMGGVVGRSIAMQVTSKWRPRGRGGPHLDGLDDSLCINQDTLIGPKGGWIRGSPLH